MSRPADLVDRAARQRALVDPEIRAERKQALVEMLNSEGWRGVARPALVRHLGEIARQLANARSAPLEKLREMQCEFALLSRLLEKPKSFFLYEGRGQEEPDAALETAE